MELLQTTQLLDYHRGMLADVERVDRYRDAIAQVVRPGDVVVDIGSGTGILAYLACQAGARRVFAIEGGPIIAVARQVCRDNGFDDRVEFIRDHSTRVTLPERADVLVTETLWNFGLGEGMLGFLADARERLLTPDARVIPAALDLFVVPLQADDYYRMLAAAPPDRHGLDFSALRAYPRHQLHVPRVSPDGYLGTPQAVATVDLREPHARELSARVTLTIERAGTLHGFAGWFDALLADGVRLGNDPAKGPSSWAHVFFPLEEPVVLSAGDEVALRLDSVANGTVWRWATRVNERRFDQTTMFGFPFDSEAQGRRAITARPQRSPLGEAVQAVIARLDGETSIEAITEEVSARFDTLFHGRSNASDFVRELAELYSR